MSDDTYYGFAGPAEDDEFNATQFVIKAQLGRVRTVMPVKIIAVHGGGVNQPPTVDVQPMINQIDSQGNSTPHGTIYGIAVSRGGFGAGNGVICDPVAGDVGIMSVADRDISGMKQTGGAQSNPGSGRKFDLSDGIYHGAMVHLSPTNFINMNGGNINIVSTNPVTINAPGLTVNGYIQATGGITAGQGGGDQVTLQGHTHGGISPGGAHTAVPDAGT